MKLMFEEDAEFQKTRIHAFVIVEGNSGNTDL